MNPRIPIRSGPVFPMLRAAGNAAGSVLQNLIPHVQPGISTGELDRLAGEYIRAAGAKSSAFGYRGYPGQICISVNDEVVHGIGSDSRIIQDGDVVSLDAAVSKNGWIGDNATTVAVGNVSDEVKKLLAVTEEALYVGISYARPGVNLADLCGAIEDFIRPYKFGIIRDFVGHGVGRSMHEEPQIPNVRPSGRQPFLKAGMALAIEPMVSLGSAKINILDDGWTVKTADGSPAAHFEHTVLITPNGPEILTVRPRVATPELLNISL